MSQATESITATPPESTSPLAAAERRRRLEAISDPWWVEVVAEMNRHTKPKLFHTPVNRDRTGFQGWGNR